MGRSASLFSFQHGCVYASLSACSGTEDAVGRSGRQGWSVIHSGPRRVAHDARLISSSRLSEVDMRGVYRAVLGFAFVAFVAQTAQAQQTIYHLHRDTLPGSSSHVISSAEPNAATLVIQSPNLNGLTNGNQTNFGHFSSLRFSQTATIPSGSMLRYNIWMRKTVSTGRLAASASLGTSLDGNSVIQFCQGTAATELTTAFVLYTFSFNTTAAIAINPTRELSLTVSVRANQNVTKTVQ